MDKCLAMTVIGHPLSITFVLQLATTTFILGLYAITESVHEQKADHQSNRHMALMVSFLFRHHPAVTNLKSLIGDNSEIGKEPGDYKDFARFLDRFIETGEFPYFEETSATPFKYLLIEVLMAPLLAFVIAYTKFDQNRLRIYRVTHTVYRKSSVSAVMGMLSINVFVGFLLAEFMLERHPILCGILLLSCLGEIISCVLVLWILIKEQQEWKQYWTSRLLEVMAVAAHKEDHDLFNRALFLKNDVDSQTDLPMPGKFSLYTTVYSIVQVVILFASRTLHFS
jgi:hypothetical protein